MRSEVKHTTPLPETPVALSGGPARGSATAPVALVVFSDFDCVFCARFVQHSEVTLRRYVSSGMLLITFRSLFSDTSHPDAFRLAKAAHCTAAQGKFWEFHDRLFVLPLSNGPAAMERKAADIGVDMSAFAECLRGDDPVQLDRDLQQAARLGLRSTPSLLLGRNSNGQAVAVTDMFVGDVDPSLLAQAIDRIVSMHPGAGQ